MDGRSRCRRAVVAAAGVARWRVQVGTADKRRSGPPRGRRPNVVAVYTTRWGSPSTPGGKQVWFDMDVAAA